MTHRVLIDCHDDALRLAREAVVGARCEVFDNRGPFGQMYELDTNGSYGRIMRDMRVPVKLLSHRYNFTLRELCGWVRDYVCIARVTVDCPLPLFPLRRNGRLTFSAGKFDTVLAGEELEYALEHGHVVDAYELAAYESHPAFSDYMQALWSLRKLSESIGNKRDADKYKLLMASFYGIWAQRGRVWEQCSRTTDRAIRSWMNVNHQTGQIEEFRQFGGIVQKLNNEEEARESHPAIAACILASARLQLWRYMALAGLDHVYYVNTDSLWTDATGVLRLRDEIKPDVLGKLKIKGVYDSVTFLAANHIITDKGVRRTGVKQEGLHAIAGDLYATQYQHVAEWIRSSEKPRPATKESKKESFKKEV